jgi:hypothetical protein
MNLASYSYPGVTKLDVVVLCKRTYNRCTLVVFLMVSFIFSILLSISWAVVLGCR